MSMQTSEPSWKQKMEKASIRPAKLIRVLTMAGTLPKDVQLQILSVNVLKENVDVFYKRVASCG